MSACCRGLNALDTALHEEAKRLLAAKLAAQAAAGQLQELPELAEADKSRVERLPKRSMAGRGVPAVARPPCGCLADTAQRAAREHWCANSTGRCVARHGHASRADRHNLAG